MLLHYLTLPACIPSEGDFNADIIRLTFRAGVSDTPTVISGSSLSVDDTRLESNEGFLLYVEINEESLDPRDRGRTDFNGLLISVVIIDDEEGRFTPTTPTEDEGDDFSLSADELAGVIAGSVVFVLILATIALLLCLCLTLWKRRKQDPHRGTWNECVIIVGKTDCRLSYIHDMWCNMYMHSLQVSSGLDPDSPSPVVAVKGEYSMQLDNGRDIHILYIDYFPSFNILCEIIAK